MSPCAQALGTVALGVVVTLVTAFSATGRETRRRAIEAAGIRE
ncbi:hypothetical protein ACTAF0_03140 [Streptomyces murinus]